MELKRYQDQAISGIHAYNVRRTYTLRTSHRVPWETQTAEEEDKHVLIEEILVFYGRANEGYI